MVVGGTAPGAPVIIGVILDIRGTVYLIDPAEDSGCVCCPRVYVITQTNTRLIRPRGKTYRTSHAWLWRHQLANRINKFSSAVIVARYPLFQLYKFHIQRLVGSQYVPQFHKCAYNINTDINRPWGIQNGRYHQSAMLGECIRQARRIFQALKVVAICDHLAFLVSCKLKYKIIREFIPVSFYLFIQSLGLCSIQFSQICVQYNL